MCQRLAIVSNQCSSRSRVRLPSSSEDYFAESESSIDDLEEDTFDCHLASKSSTNDACPVCGGTEMEDGEGVDWVVCDSCHLWYHVNCSSIPLSSYGNVTDINCMGMSDMLLVRVNMLHNNFAGRVLSHQMGSWPPNGPDT